MIFFLLFYLAILAAGFSVGVFLCALPFLLRKPAMTPNRFGASSMTRGPLQAVIGGFQRFADVHGRASRMDFWCFAVFVVLCGIAELVGLWVWLNAGYEGTLWMLLPIFGPPAVLALPSLSMAIRRLHDGNRSGWWLLLLFVCGWFILLYWFVQPSRDHDPAEAF